jgi:hypothetical protein
VRARALVARREFQASNRFGRDADETARTAAGGEGLHQIRGIAGHRLQRLLGAGELLGMGPRGRKAIIEQHRHASGGGQCNQRRQHGRGGAAGSDLQEGAAVHSVHGGASPIATCAELLRMKPSM